MPILRKNIPTRQTLVTHYRYIEHGKHEGRLIKIDMPEAVLDHMEIGQIRICKGKPYRMLSLRGHSYPEDKLVYLMAKGFYPDNAILHINGDRMDSRIENLKLTAHRNLPDPASESGVIGISLVKSGANEGRWAVRRTEYTYIERPKVGKKTRGWQSREIETFTKTKQIHVGYADTLAEAKQMLKNANMNHLPQLKAKTDNEMQDRLDTIKQMGVRWYIGQLWDNQKISIRTIDLFEEFFGVEADLNRPATQAEWDAYETEKDTKWLGRY